MRTLVIECATEACSVALLTGGEVVAATHRVLGRGHAEQLVPMISALPGRGRADRILVSLGPGSFTGVRIGIATAKALGFAWQAAVLGYPTLDLVAAIAMGEKGWPAITVCMTGGHGEWFVQDFGYPALALGPWRSLAPDEAAARDPGLPLAGTQAAALSALLPGRSVAAVTLPDAAHIGLLPPAVFTTKVAPIYGRGPDARLPG
jgi:tRNA threonylcarbamoyl adenosine modification protein YeaZ